MAAKKKAKAKGKGKAKKKKKACTSCGGPVNGRGKLCGRCDAATAARRVEKKVRDRVAAAMTGEFVCPFCRRELDWQNVGFTEAEVSIYVREKIYFCPNCRSFLGVSSWHSEG